MVVIKIHDWHPERAWASSFQFEGFATRMRMYTDLNKREIKALAAQVRAHACKEIRLPKARNRYEATSVRSFLEAQGAETTIEEILNPRH